MNEEPVIIPILAIMLPIIITLGAFVMIAYVRKYENIERMAIIDKGLSPDLFLKKERSTSGPLRAGFLFVGAGLGLLIGYALDRTYDMEEVGYFSMLLIFGGLGLLLAYVVEDKKSKKE